MLPQYALGIFAMGSRFSAKGRRITYIPDRQFTFWKYTIHMHRTDSVFRAANEHQIVVRKHIMFFRRHEAGHSILNSGLHQHRRQYGNKGSHRYGEPSFLGDTFRGCLYR